jgi:hypothetical protein
MCFLQRFRDRIRGAAMSIAKIGRQNEDSLHTFSITGFIFVTSLCKSRSRIGLSHNLFRSTFDLCPCFVLG